MSKRFELIIFDCDGVLVDSERLANQVFADMLVELGLAVDLDYMFEHFMGRSMAQCLEQVEEMLGRPPPEDFLPGLRARTRAAFEASLTATPGVEEALGALSLPCCVASSGEHEKMRLTLGLTGLLPRFENRLFSATEVARGKPAPDIYLHAARRCGTEPAACLVIEDSPAGVTAGVAAGMTVYGYAGLTPALRLYGAGADRVFDDMAELPELVQ